MPALADRTQRKLTFFILSVAFLAMLYLSWMRWGSLYVDTFRDQWVYHNILSGEIVYKDFFYPYGFLPPYLGAIFYRFFGETLYSSVAFGMIVTALSVLVVYRISRFFLDRFLSTFVVLNFITIFAFGGQSEIFNFILPHSSATTVAMLFILLMVYFAAKFIFTEKQYCLSLAAVSLYFIILSRLEFGFLASLSLVICGTVYFFMRRDCRLLLFTVAAVLAGFLSYLMFLWVSGAYDGFWDSVWKIFTAIPREHYFELRLGGFLDPVKNALYALSHLAVQLFAALFFILTVLRSGTQRFSRAVALIGLIGVLPLVAVTRFPYYGIYASLPTVLVLGMVFIVYRFRQSAGDFKLNFSLFLLFLTALIISLRVILNFSVFNYGVAFGALALIPFYIFWFKFFPGIFIGASASSRFYSLPLMVFFILLNAPLFADNADYYAKKNIPVKTDRGIIFSSPSRRVSCFWQTVAYLNAVTAPGQTLVVMPEGIGINYFCHMATLLRYETFLPCSFAYAGGEGNIIEMLAQYKADYIVITGRATPEYGYSAFGLDYAKRTASWIRANYRLEKVFGKYPFTSPEFGIAVFKHK